MKLAVITGREYFTSAGVEQRYSRPEIGDSQLTRFRSIWQRQFSLLAAVPAAFDGVFD